MSLLKELVNFRKKLRLLHSEIESKIDKLGDDDTNWPYIEEDGYIVGNLLDKVDLFIKNLGEAPKGKLLSLNMKNWKKNRV